MTHSRFGSKKRVPLTFVLPNFNFRSKRWVGSLEGLSVRGNTGLHRSLPTRWRPKSTDVRQTLISKSLLTQCPHAHTHTPTSSVVVVSLHGSFVTGLPILFMVWFVTHLFERPTWSSSRRVDKSCGEKGRSVRVGRKSVLSLSLTSTPTRATECGH